MADEHEGKQGFDKDKSFEDLSAAEFQSYTKGIDYPKSRDGIAECVKKNGAPDSVVQTFHRLPDKEYETAADLSKAFGKLK